MATAVGLSKVFILDKYFSELQKFWDTERNAPLHLPSLILSQLVSLPDSQQQPINEANNNHLLAHATAGPGHKPSAGHGSAMAAGQQEAQPAAQQPAQQSARQQVNAALSLELLMACKQASHQLRQAHRPSNDAHLAECGDLIHLAGPLTEDLITRTLHARFRAGEYFSSVGPVLLSVNALQDVGNPLTLSSVAAEPLRSPQLLRVVQDAVRQQSETGYPQAVILSGQSGSGKTYASMICLRHLFDMAGGGPETDAFKHLAAAFTVLRSLGSAKVASNQESSRIGHFIEVQVTDGALYRTKIHSYFLDQTRVVRPAAREKNYHIFYQMLAGLTKDERLKLHLDGYTARNLRYLSCGDVTEARPGADAQRFEAWKSALAVLGIPFMDVVRVLAAILLLGNVQLNGEQSKLLGCDPELSSIEPNAHKSEIRAVATLLGVSSTSLVRGLTRRTVRKENGQILNMACDANAVSMQRFWRQKRGLVLSLSGTLCCITGLAVRHRIASHRIVLCVTQLTMRVLAAVRVIVFA